MATSTTDREIIITRRFAAPRELVFKVWTEPQHLAKWWGPKALTILSSELDVRPGGAWRRCLRSPDGTVHWKRGVYSEIVPPQSLVFTYEDEDGDGNASHQTLVTVTFVDIGGKTELTLHQAVFETQAAHKSHQLGWAGSLEGLAEYLAQSRQQQINSGE